MTREACFRCDWEGEAEGPVCPRCGTPLYRPRASPRPAPARESPREAPTPSPSARGRFLPNVEREDVGAAPVRRRPFLAFAALAVLLTGVIWWFLRAHEVPAGSGGGTPPPPTGRLVYTAGAAGAQRLWTWDPPAAAATPGPAVDGEVVQLVGARGGLAGLLGLTARDRAGRLSASILRSQTADASAEPVVTADLVAWGPDGASVVSARVGDTVNGCYEHPRVFRELLDRGLQEEVLSRQRLCGRISTLGQTFASTYFTWARDAGVGVFVLGNGEPHELLPGWALLGTSPTSDLLVAPASPTEAAAGGTALFWRGARQPDPYRSAAGGSVEVRRILTWTTQADEVLVVATVDDREGLYLLNTTPGGDRVPAYVGVAQEPAFATATFDDALYLSLDGRLVLWRDGHMADAGLPVDAPPPTGPIAWLPG